MPEKRTLERAKRDKVEGKSPSTQAGEFVREEIHHVREGKHGARSPKQAIAIGLSKARRAGVELAPPSPEQASEATRKHAKQDAARGSKKKKASARRPSAKRKRATSRALAREPHRTASKRALGKQARAAAARRSPADRSAAARKAARTRTRRNRVTRAKRKSTSATGSRGQGRG